MENKKHARVSSSSSTPDRKTVEKDRRNRMKGLYSELNSLVPSREELSGEHGAVTLPDQLEEAATYVKKLQIRVEKMREKRENLVTGTVEDDNKPNKNIQIHQTGSTLKMILVTGLEYRQVVFNEAIRVIHEEGAEVVNASFTVSDQTVFHTIHCEIGGFTSNNGASRIYERLNKLVRETNAN